MRRTTAFRTASLAALLLFALLTATAQQPGVSATQLSSLELQSLGSDAIYSAFGTYLAVVTRTNRTRVYDANYEELWNYRGQGHHGQAPCVAFTSDEELLILPGYGSPSRIAVVRAATGEMVQTLDGHDDDVTALALSPDNEWLVSVQYGGNTVVWRREGSGFVMNHRVRRPGHGVTAIAFAPSSRLFAIGNNQDFVELYGLDHNAGAGSGGGPAFISAGELRPNQYYGNTGYIYGLDFSPDGRWLATGVRDEITIWELDGTDVVSTDIIPEINEGYCYSIEFSPDSTVLFAGFQGSRAAAWSLAPAGGWLHETTFADRQDYVWDLAITPDGSQLATVSVTSNGIAIWDLAGVEPGPLFSLAAMIADATGSNGLGKAYRAILTDESAANIMGSVDDSASAPRGMFETAEAYEERIANAGGAVVSAVQAMLLDHFGGEDSGDGLRITVPVQEQGTYDIDAGRYTTRFMGIHADLAITPMEAQDLYLNWEGTLVQAERDPDSPVYGNYQLLHPTNGKRYPLLLAEDPMSGVRRDAAGMPGQRLELADGLVLEDLRLDPIFPALYRSYENLPVGHATLWNTGDLPAQAMRMTSTLARYSEDPATVETPRALASGDRTPVELPLVLSDEIVRSGGEESISIEISVRYETDGTEHSGSATALVPILNRNAISWHDDRTVGAFMTTVQSPTVMTLSGGAAADAMDAVAAALPRPLLIAMRVFEELRERGIAYRVDPASAYADLSQSAGAIDFLQFPAETLAYGAGDCDDLAVLFNSILEAAGVRTAFITTPGHIFTAFALERGEREIAGIFPDPGEFIAIDGRVWLPVETTVLDAGFREAWRVGARQWRAAEAERSAGIFTTEEAWRVYPPVPWEPPVREVEQRPARNSFQSELNDYVDEAIALMIAERGVAEPGTAREYNLRGTIYARFGVFEQARAAFEQAAEMADYVPALVNLASVTALEGDHVAALEILGEADSLSPDNPRILLGMAVEHLEDGRRGSARDLYDRAAALDPRLAVDFPLFASGGSGEDGARASGENPVDTYRLNAWAE